ncbi:hypothetical protein SHKM778_43330 [Streptomyces sp. KM77-8]|uniref:Uncharacterized protein n=1 Tax=Streptomyces haneummycinicus TaxID=3074435 RepID=A0AAT9HKR5_9ACTN
MEAVQDRVMRRWIARAGAGARPNGALVVPGRETCSARAGSVSATASSLPSRLGSDEAVVLSPPAVVPRTRVADQLLHRERRLLGGDVRSVRFPLVHQRITRGCATRVNLGRESSPRLGYGRDVARRGGGGFGRDSGGGEVLGGLR